MAFCWGRQRNAKTRTFPAWLKTMQRRPWRVLEHFEMELATAVGLIGAVAYLAGYALIQMRVLTIDDGRYAALNVLGGVALIYSLMWNFNLGSFLTQAAWLVFTVVGYAHSRHQRRKNAAKPAVIQDAANDPEPPAAAA